MAAAWTPCGVHEHFYSTNFAGEINRSTHYIVLAYEAERALDPASLPHAQHRGYRWLSPAAIVADPDVHPYTRLLQGVRAMTNPPLPRRHPLRRIGLAAVAAVARAAAQAVHPFDR